MKSKRRKFRKIRSIGQFQVIPQIEKWIPTANSSKVLIKRVAGLTDDQFNKIVTEVLHYQITRLILSRINFALKERVREYVNQLQEDILKLSPGAIAVEQKLLTRLVKINYAEIERTMSKLWSDPNVLYFNNLEYRKTFDLIVQYTGKNRTVSATLRKQVSFEFYSSVGEIKLLFKMRYPKKTFHQQYWSFLSSHILSDVKLSNFLRGGKTQRSQMDPKDFETIRSRFLKGYREKRQ